jgi:predicted nucleic acid-binding protein
MKAVIDASAALKWQFKEEDASEASIALLEDFVEGKIELITVTLFSYEILSALSVAIKRGRITEAIGQKALTYLTSLGIEEKTFDDLIGTTFKIARKFHLSPYDCAYAALAEKEECNFYTGDKKLFNAAKVHLPKVQWIGNY